MLIMKRIKLGNSNYYFECTCEYKKIDGYNRLCLKNYKDSYYDGGDISRLIKKIEEKYDKSIYTKYGNEITFLSDILYIYDNIPFIDGVGDLYITSDGIINSLSYMSREEIDEYIKNNNINMNNNDNFKLFDEETWNIN